MMSISCFLLLLYLIYLSDIDAYHGAFIRHPHVRYDISEMMASVGRESFVAPNRVVKKLRYVSVEDRAKVSINLTQYIILILLLDS